MLSALRSTAKQIKSKEHLVVDIPSAAVSLKDVIELREYTKDILGLSDTMHQLVSEWDAGTYADKERERRTVHYGSQPAYATFGVPWRL